MASTRSAVQSNSSSDYWPPELSDELGAVDLDHGRSRRARRPSFGKRFLRMLFTLGLGVGGTLAWQSYGDTAREMIANASPQLGWLAPPAVAAAPAAAETDASAATAAAAPAAPAPDQQQLNATSLGLAAVRQSIDQLAAQLAASQQQMANQIAKLQSADQDILQKIAAPPQIAAPPRPAAPPARKPVALTPPPPLAPATAAR
jgi:hypothetical protein